MILSAIVATFNRAESLQRLLASVTAVNCPADVDLEVLVVNNGSTDNTAALLRREELTQGKFSLKVFEEPRKGKAVALNRGLPEAAGHIFAVLDDDVVVHPDWLAEHVMTYRNTSFDVVQGRVLPGFNLATEAPADPSRPYEYNVLMIDHGEESCEIRGFTGTNVTFRREVFEKVGFFDVRLGPGAAGYSEDTEYSRRIRNAGFRIGYAPRALAYHELNPSRYGRKYNRMTHYQKGLSRAIYRHDSMALKILPDLAANCMRYGLYRITGKAEKAYKTEGRIMKNYGYLMGKLRGR